MKLSHMITLLFLISLVSSYSSAQESSQHPFEAYALASAWSTVGVPAAGFRLGGEWQPRPRLGLVADLSHNFNSDEHIRSTALMVGPRFYSHEQYRLSGFTQVLLGSQTSSYSGANRQSPWNLVLAAGAGFDIRLTDRLVFRPVEFELTLSQGLGSARASSGFAFKFGQ